MKKRRMPILFCMLFIVSIIIQPMTVDAAVQEMKVDKKEYNLHIEDLPSFTSEWDSIFAKLNNVKDSSAYALSLFDDTDSSDLLIAGLEKAKISVDPDNVYGVDIMIYKLDSDGEYYPAENSMDCTIICPVPDFWTDDAQNLNLYSVSKSGEAKTTSFSLVKVGDVTCMKFDMKNTGVYGFVFNESEVKSEENTESKPTAAPTKAPAPTPTKIPVTTPSYGEQAKPTNTPAATPTSAPVKAPTKAPSQQSTVKPSTNANQSQVTQSVPKPHTLDATPQTGDNAPTGQWMLAAGLSASAIAGILFLLKHRH